MSGELACGTAWRIVNGCGCFHPTTHCRGGQHVGPRACWVLLFRRGRVLAIQSGLRSTHKASKAMADAVTWPDVPFLVEGVEWREYEDDGRAARDCEWRVSPDALREAIDAARDAEGGES